MKGEPGPYARGPLVARFLNLVSGDPDGVTGLKMSGVLSSGDDTWSSET